MYRPASLPSEPASPLAPPPTVSFRTPLRNALPSPNHILTRAPLPQPPPRTPPPLHVLLPCPVSRRHSVVGNVVDIISRLLMISLRGSLLLSHSHYYIEILLTPFTPLLRTFDDALASSLRMHSTLNRSIVNSSSQMALGEG
ncbi:hypothetical protein BLNAU_16277 [Blattamonas nauphoetae]|uniref:Uncharacterized protein n=1 Tax=Blattamonas nauphoetae TaxID=2049346 RepID=A0ABQ9WVH2_9EUKA|nr:hypothetical protein BLNAU_21573 [Blattamonas nauphoetae]KAK2948827.1 hypothetical protein BLNAU_16277 [Blattamonas nauphoetae]